MATNYSNNYSGAPYRPPDPWLPNVPTPPSTAPGTPKAYTAWTPTGIPTDASGWNTQTKRDQYSQYLSAQLPLQQYNQNAQQYANDFNEAQRRWNQQMGWTQTTDQYNMNLSGRQQTMAEWQAQEAARQWQNQFDYQQGNDAFSQNLATTQQQLAQQTQDQSYQLQSQANAINQAYNNGRLTNDQRQLALAELTQQQNYAFQQQNLNANMGWNQTELAATQQYRAQQDALARAQMAQDYQIQQQQMEAQRQNAILQATGRNVAPSVKWMRRS